MNRRRIDRKIRLRPALWAGAALVLAGTAVAPAWSASEQAPPPETEARRDEPVHGPEGFPAIDTAPRSDQLGALVHRGREVYDTLCVGCHGEHGDGQGKAAPMLIVKPRDFTKGIYKFRSTAWGELPTEEDLYKIITRGIYGTAMPAFGLVPERDRLAVIQYVKTFAAERWTEDGPGTPVHIPEPPASLGTPAAVARGAELFDMLECWACHGKTGVGDGPSAAELDPDAWGNPQKPFNFTRGVLRGGPTSKDVYRTFMTGVYGTAMPSYYDIFSEPDGENIYEGDAWNLVSYILSLRQQGSGGAQVSARGGASE